MSYEERDLFRAYEALGVTAGRTIFLASDLGRLGPYAGGGRKEILEAHLRVLLELLGADGTIVVPTASSNICNTDTPFDVAATPSFRTGALSEFIRQHPQARRSFHPFTSYTALGRMAVDMVGNVSRHAYGPLTPEANLLEADALSISVGIEPHRSCSTVHHAEHLMAVPYRYAKEFLHPVVRDGAVRAEPFYMHVWYRDCGINRFPLRIWERFAEDHGTSSQPVGASFIYAYSMSQYLKSAVCTLRDDIYAWCEGPPTSFPWRL